mmetsp:Transcript_92514/g.238831  ORF Transcript_92514/g.238831 Transcript_92514/m.238831 type:complete len:250 (-) Transcript_92514:9-758(-)
MVGVGRHVASRALREHGRVDRAWCLIAAVAAVCARHADRVGAGERVPNRGATATLVVRSFNLVGCRALAPHKALRELVAGRTDRVGRWVLVRPQAVRVGHRISRAIVRLPARAWALLALPEEPLLRQDQVEGHDGVRVHSFAEAAAGPCFQGLAEALLLGGPAGARQPRARLRACGHGGHGHRADKRQRERDGAVAHAAARSGSGAQLAELHRLDIAVRQEIVALGRRVAIVAQAGCHSPISAEAGCWR